MKYNFFSKDVPDVLPNDLRSLLSILESFRYKSYGVPRFYLKYCINRKGYGIFFANPIKNLPTDIFKDSPEEACKEMINSLLKDYHE